MKPYPFPNEGVIVELPSALVNYEVEGEAIDALPPPGGEFQYTDPRPVIRFNLKKKQGAKEKFKEITHPIHITVFFSQDDLDKLLDKKSDELTLGIHFDNKWRAFKLRGNRTWDDKKDKAQDPDNVPDHYEGYVKIKIKGTDDPAVGWGP
jgi:hypothetical protein